MKIIYFSSNLNMLESFKKRDFNEDTLLSYDINSINIFLLEYPDAIVVADYDSVASDINNFLSSNTLPKNLIVLESVPELITGKMLISRGIKAYGNSRMLNIHYKQMIDTVKSSKVWTYPELTASLSKVGEVSKLSEDSIKLLNHRLSKKELEVIYIVLKGLSNDAIASDLEITTRTVKAHISSIFKKLHVSDRISLVLLLK